MLSKRQNSHTDTDRLFHSESGYYYRPTDIALFIAKQDQYPSLFSDFRTVRQDTHPTINMFTVRDLQQLLTHTEIFRAVRQHRAFFELREWCLDFREQTLALMFHLAQAAECLENPFTALNAEVLGQRLTAPLVCLYQHLHQNTRAAKHERKILTALTSTDGILGTYSIGRTTNLIQDLHALIHQEKCAAGFNRHLAGVYASIQSCKLYQESMWQLIPSDSAKLRLFANSKRPRPENHSQPQEETTHTISPPSSYDADSLPPTQDMNNDDATEDSAESAITIPLKRINRYQTYS